MSDEKTPAPAPVRKQAEKWPRKVQSPFEPGVDVEVGPEEWTDWVRAGLVAEGK